MKDAAELAARLIGAARSGTAVEPLTWADGPLDVDLA